MDNKADEFAKEIVLYLDDVSTHLIEIADMIGVSPLKILANLTIQIADKEKRIKDERD